MSGPYDTYFSVKADVAKFLSTQQNILYHRGADPTVLIGEDTKHYIVFPLADNTQPYLGQIEAQTYHQYTTSDFATALAAASNLTAALSGLTIVATHFIPCPGTKYVMWIGANTGGAGVQGKTIVALRFKIDNTGTLVFDYGGGTGASLWTTSNFHQQLYFGVGGGGPFGAAVIGAYLYAVLMISDGFAGITYTYNASVLVKIPYLAGGGVNTVDTSWDTVHVELPQHTIGANPYVSEVAIGANAVGQRQSRVSIWDANGDGSLIGCLNYEYYSDTSGAPKLRYYPVTASTLVVGATVDYTSSIAAVTATAGLNFAGVAGSIYDDWSTPTIFDGTTFVFSRSFSDSPHTLRIFQYNTSFNLLSGPTDIPNAITQSMTLACVNQTPIAAYKTDNSEIVLIYDTGFFIYLATFGPPPVTPAPPEGGIPALSVRRAWAYTLDGHVNYVLDLDAQGTFQWDNTIGVPQTGLGWAQYVTSGQVNWNVANGCMWGNRIVGGDLATTNVWEVRTGVTTDQDASLQINHIATGAVPSRTREKYNCSALRVVGSAGNLGNTSGSALNMRFSDDNGQTWSPTYAVTLTQNDFRADMSFRALGSFALPGRVFEISDAGGPVRIDGVVAEIPEIDDASPSG